MTERIDHAAEALRIMHEVSNDGSGTVSLELLDDVEQWVYSTSMHEAQVHATLALVEQQRVANLIAYVAQWNAQYVAGEARPGLFDEDTYEESLRRREHASALMREGLGL